MHRARGLILLLVCFALAPWPARAGVSDRIEAMLEEFNSTPRRARDAAGLLPVGYVEVYGRSYAYSVPRRFVRLAREGEAFHLKRPKKSETDFTMEARTSKGAKLRIRIQPYGLWPEALVDTVVAVVVAQVFDFGPPPAFKRLVGNRGSQVYHLNGCNHLPEAGQRSMFDDQAEAAKRGFRPCPICFNQAALPLEGYGPMRSVAEDAARIYEIANPPVADSELQSSFTRVGEKILARFPISTHGYDYRFRVVESELPGASSFATGFVYMTKPLWDAIEDSLELELVLAHEIAHVEAESVDQEREAKKSPLLVTPLEVEAQYARARARELEKDLVALEYLRANYPGAAPQRRAGNALLKLQFFTEGTPGEEAKVQDTHPAFGERVLFFDPQRTMLTPGSPRFVGLDQSGDTLVVVRVVGGNRGVFSRRAVAKLKTDALFGTAPVQQTILLARVDEGAEEPLTRLSGKLENTKGQDLNFAETVLADPIPPGGEEALLILSAGAPEVVSDLERGKIDTNLDVDRWIFEAR